MKKNLMDILACPQCKSLLELEVDEEEGDDIVKGFLLCNNCKETFPISESIPNFLLSCKRS